MLEAPGQQGPPRSQAATWAWLSVTPRGSLSKVSVLWLGVHSRQTLAHPQPEGTLKKLPKVGRCLLGLGAGRLELQWPLRLRGQAKGHVSPLFTQQRQGP